MKRSYLLLMTGLVVTASPAAPAAEIAPHQVQLAPQVEPEAQVQPALQTLPWLVMLPFENHLRDQDPAVSRHALETFQAELLRQQQRPYRVLDPRQVSFRLNELTRSDPGLAVPARAIELGRRLGAGLLLSGSVLAGKIHTSEATRRQPTVYTWATIQVRATMTNVETGEILFSGEATGKSGLYPTWRSNGFTGLILEGVAAAAKDLAAQMMLAQAQQGVSAND